MRKTQVVFQITVTHWVLPLPVEPDPGPGAFDRDSVTARERLKDFERVTTIQTGGVTV